MELKKNLNSHSQDVISVKKAHLTRKHTALQIQYCVMPVGKRVTTKKCVSSRKVNEIQEQDHGIFLGTVMAEGNPWLIDIKVKDCEVQIKKHRC